MGKGATSDETYLLRADNVWWRCAQYFVTAIMTIDVCIWRMFVFMFVVVTVGFRGNVCCVAAVVEYSVFSLGVLKYVVCLCMRCYGCCVFCLYCEAWRCRCSCMGSVSVSSYICCMFVSCVHPVAVLNAAFCMTCSLLMLVEDARGEHT